MMLTKQDHTEAKLPPYQQLIAIVKLLLSNGNQLSGESSKHPDTFGFYQDKDGWICDLRFKINQELINATLPPDKSITISSTGVFCKNTWTSIRSNIA